MTSDYRISILEDSLELQDLLSQSLTSAGYQVRTYGRANDFESELDSWKPDVSIIDLGLPDRDGLGILQSLSTSHSTAILVISGRSNITDKIVGLELGADDYLAKPFETSELIARVRALLRRFKTTAKPETKSVYHLAGLTIDTSKFLITDPDGKQERLSASEVEMLNVFLKNPNRLVTRDKLRDELGDKSDDLSFDRAIDVRVSRLRSKLKDAPKNPKIIKTVYGAGYILISDAD
jgi:DNA-binding response OmpR family regulator